MPLFLLMRAYSGNVVLDAYDGSLAGLHANEAAARRRTWALEFANEGARDTFADGLIVALARSTRRAQDDAQMYRARQTTARHRRFIHAANDCAHFSGLPRARRPRADRASG